MATKCPKCEEKRGLGQWKFHWGNVPKSGPAAEAGLCTKCYREKFGPISPSGWSRVIKWCRAFVRAKKESSSAAGDK